MPISNIYQNEIEYIKSNYYPIFSINLRCFTCQIKDQVSVISEVINNLKKIYSNSYFFIGGFLGDYNEEILTKQNIEIATLNGSYSHLLTEYENTFINIKNNVNHTDLKSLINLKINNILEFTKIVNFSIHNNCGYSIIESVIHNIPSMYFGTKWIDHVKKSCFISKEQYNEPIYIEGLNYISENIYDSITCEITNDKIVKTILDYDNNNNLIFTKYYLYLRNNCIVCGENNFEKSFILINTINVVENEIIPYCNDEIKYLDFVECTNCNCIQLKNLFNPDEIYNQPSHYLEGELWKNHNIL